MKRFPILFLVLMLVLVALGASHARSISGTGMSQGDEVAFLELLQTRLNLDRTARTVSYPNLHAHAAASETVDIGTTFYYVLDGIYYAKTASDTIASVTASAQATGTTCLYLLSLDSSGSVTTTKGTAVTYGSTPAWPTLPADHAPFGGISVAILGSASQSWTMGTDAWNLLGASTTVAIYNLFMVPAADIDMTDF